MLRLKAIIDAPFSHNIACGLREILVGENPLEHPGRTALVGPNTVGLLGAVITLLAVCKITHREAYADVFMVAIAGPMISLVAIIAIASLFGSF